MSVAGFSETDVYACRLVDGRWTGAGRDGYRYGLEREQLEGGVCSLLKVAPCQPFPPCSTPQYSRYIRHMATLGGLIQKEI